MTSQKIDVNKEQIKEYQKALLENNILKKEKIKRVKLHHDFIKSLENDITTNFARLFKACLDDEKKKKEQKKGKKKGKKKEKKEDDKTDLNIEMTCNDDFGQTGTSDLPTLYSDQDIEEFLENLIFVVDLPNEVDLGKLTGMELNKDFNLKDDELIPSFLQAKILDWFKEKESRFLSSEEASKLLQSLESGLYSLAFIGATKKFTEPFEKIWNDFDSKTIFQKNEFDVCFSEDTRNFCIFYGGSLFLMELKIHQILKEKFRKIDNDFVFDKLSSLLSTWMSNKVVSVFKNTKWLVISCDYEGLKRKNVFKYLLQELSDNITSDQKIILICETNIDNDFIPVQDNSKIEHLRKMSSKESLKYFNQSVQKALLEKEVYFQVDKNDKNDKMTKRPLLNQLITTEVAKEIVPSSIIIKLLKNEDVQIGNKMQSCKREHDLDHYIERIFNPVLFNSKIERLNTIDGSTDSVITDENIEKFENDTSGKKNVHWIQKIKCKYYWRQIKFHYQWKQTKGSISKVREYRYNTNCCIKAQSEKELLKSEQKIILISDTAGMGKSTLLTSLAEKIKEELPFIWVIRLDLNNYSSEFKKKIDEYTLNSETKIAAIFLFDLMKSQPETKFKNDFEEKLLGAALEDTGNIVLMFDGFDEISPNYKDIAIRLITCLRESKVDKIFLSTRPNMNEELQQNFDSFSYNLVPLSYNEQKTYLEKIWLKNLRIEENNNDENEDTPIKRLKLYVKSLLDKMSTSISDRERKFTGIPLQIKLLAEAFEGKDVFLSCSNPLDEQSQVLSFTQKEQLGNKTANEAQHSEIYQDKKKEKGRQFQSCKEFVFEDKEIFPKLPERLDLVDLYELFIKRKHDIFYEEKLKANKAIPAADDEKENGYQDFIETHQKLALMRIFDKEALSKILPDKKENDQLLQKIKDKRERIGLIDQILDDKPNFIHLTFAEYFVAQFFVLKMENGMSSDLKDLLFCKVLRNSQNYQTVRAFVDSFLKKRKEFQITVNDNTLLKEIIYLAVKENKCNILVTLIGHFQDTKKEKIVNTKISLNYFNDSLLEIAVKEGHFEMVAQLIEYKANLETKYSWNQTMLILLLDQGTKPNPRKNFIEIASLIINSGANVKTEDNWKKTGLHYAARGKGKPIVLVKQLIEKGAIVNAKDINGKTPLHCACTREWGEDADIEIVKCLWEHGADINEVDNEGATPLHLAVEENHPDVAKFLLKKGAKVNAQDKEKNTPLHKINGKTNINIVDFLLSDISVDPEIKNENDEIPLIIAIQIDRLDIVDLIFCRTEHSKKKVREEIILAAAFYSTVEMCKFFEEQSFCFDNVCFDYYIDDLTPFLKAVQSKDLEKCKWLEKKGASITVTTKETRQNALHIVLDIELCKWLIKMGVDINAKDYYNNTPLHVVWELEDGKSELLLKQKGIQANEKNKYGITPLHLAAAEGTKNVCELLLDCGADIHTEDLKGRSPLLIAFKSELENRDLFTITIFLLSRGAIPKTLADNCKKKVYFRRKYPSEPELYISPKKLTLNILDAKYGSNKFNTSYLEICISCCNGEVLFKAFALYYDPNRMECWFSVHNATSDNAKIQLWNFIKELKQDKWESSTGGNQKQKILNAQINHCFVKGAATGQTTIDYLEMNKKCLINYTKDEHHVCKCEKITKFIFAEIHRHHTKQSEKYANQNEMHIEEVSLDNEAMKTLYDRDMDHWSCSKESQNDDNLIESDSSDYAESDLSACDSENSDTEVNQYEIDKLDDDDETEKSSLKI
jgi:ankyrin repeat protein